MQKITPFIWFDSQAEEAANYYVSLFKNSKILKVTRYDMESAKASGRPAGSVMTVAFQLAGQEFVALNGGPTFQITGGISFVVNCESQEEIDHFWEKLSEGGEKGICGWINSDKFGLTWQVVPTILAEMLSDPDPRKSERVMKTLLQMKKISIAGLKKAYGGG